MATRRVSPLTSWSIAAVIVLMVAALLATGWTTRAAVKDASRTVRAGQAVAAEQAVRADLADLGGVPTPGDLAAILDERAPDGLRYIGILDGDGNVAAAAGTPVGPVELRGSGRGEGARRTSEVNGRIRLEVRAPFRRAWGAAGRAWWIALELEPVQADELRTAASRTLGIGLLAATALLVVAVVLVRREVRRNADERVRERERRLASLGELSAVLAHEIRNPLASLKGNAQLLAQMLAQTMQPGDKPRAKADRVVEEAVRLEGLTNDLLAFVRTGNIVTADVDPGALVRDAAASTATPPGTIEIDTARAPASWALDAGRIREVVVNLLDNAAAAGPPVRATVAAAGEHLVIEIADRGPGVPAEDRDRIFEPFFTNKTQGTGLGLAVARRIVELHGGTITVGDHRGGGAVFRVELPRG